VHPAARLLASEQSSGRGGCLRGYSSLVRTYAGDAPAQILNLFLLGNSLGFAGGRRMHVHGRDNCMHGGAWHGPGPAVVRAWASEQLSCHPSMMHRSIYGNMGHMHSMHARRTPAAARDASVTVPMTLPCTAPVMYIDVIADVLLGTAKAPGVVPEIFDSLDVPDWVSERLLSRQGACCVPYTGVEHVGVLLRAWENLSMLHYSATRNGSG
jgi:hypothetical protein